jgi:hypothetical protein
MRAAVAIAACVAVGFGYALAQRGPAELELEAHSAPAAEFPLVGSYAQDFTLPVFVPASANLADSVRLSDFDGRWVYLDVFAKYPEMQRVATELQEEGAVVVGLLLAEEPQTALDFFEEAGMPSYPFAVLDEHTAAQWAITGAPMGILVSPEGRIERRCLGCSSDAERIGTLPEFVRARTRG